MTTQPQPGDEIGRTPRQLWEEPEVVMVLAAETLQEYLAKAAERQKESPRAPFVSACRYSRAGDFFEVYWKNDSCYAEECGGITLMKSQETHEVVGVQFFGVKKRMGLKEVT